MIEVSIDFTDVAPQSRGDAEDRRFRVRDHAGQGNPGYCAAADISRQSGDNLYTEKETEVLLLVGKEAALLSNLHATELHSGVRGELYAGALPLRTVLHAK